MLPKIVASSVLWLPLTLGIYIAGSGLYCRAGKAPLLNPTLLTICSVTALLVVFEVPYTTYFESVSILHYLLGTAVVALAIPLHQNLHKLRGELRPVALALVAGSRVSVAVWS